MTVSSGPTVQAVVIATILKMQITKAANVDANRDGDAGNLHGVSPPCISFIHHLTRKVQHILVKLPVPFYYLFMLFILFYSACI